MKPPIIAGDMMMSIFVSLAHLRCFFLGQKQRVFELYSLNLSGFSKPHFLIIIRNKMEENRLN